MEITQCMLYTLAKGHASWCEENTEDPRQIQILSEIRPSSSSSCTPNGALCEDLTEDRIVFTFINVVDADMSIQSQD